MDKNSSSLSRLSENVRNVVRRRAPKRKPPRRCLSLSLIHSTNNIVRCHSVFTSSGFSLERGSIASAVSTESGIHMGSEHDASPGTPEPIVQGSRIKSIIKNVRRSHSYNVCDANKSLKTKDRYTVRPKSLVGGWEQSAISADEILLWQTQLRQLHKINKTLPNMKLISKKGSKLPKKDSLRHKAKTLISHFKDKRKNKGSVSSSESRYSEHEPDSTSSYTERSAEKDTLSMVKYTEKCPQLGKWTSKDDTMNPSDALRILKVFAGGGLSSANAEYRSVLATVDTTILEIKKQSISKYGFDDGAPDSYVIARSTGSYLDSNGKTITSSTKTFGSKSEEWIEIEAVHLNDDMQPLAAGMLIEDEQCTRLEIRPVMATSSKKVKDKRSRGFVTSLQKPGGLHHFPTDCPFLLLMHGVDLASDYVIYPLPEGLTVFRTADRQEDTLPHLHNVVLLHTNEEIDNIVINRSGAKCTLCTSRMYETQLRSGQCFPVGGHYQFMFKDTSEEHLALSPSEEHLALSPEVGSPDTQRTLSTGTLTSLSPDFYLNNISAVVHQHAEPRFVFYMMHKEELLESILSYETLSHKYPLTCSLITIMCLRHATETFKPHHLTEILLMCKDKLEALGKAAQQKAIMILNNKSGEKASPASFLRPMMRLLANTLEILHYLKETKQDSDIVHQIEKLSVSMFEYVAYHTAKLVYELLPSVLEDNKEEVSAEQDVKLPDNDTRDTSYRRWSVPMSLVAVERKRKRKTRPRGVSLCTVAEGPPVASKSRSCGNINEWKCSNGDKSSSPSSSTSEHTSWLSSSPSAEGIPTMCRWKGTSQPPDLYVSVAMRSLIKLLQKFHNLSTSCKLNNAMVKQLFTSIFFFSNTTLFNILTESSYPQFNWHRGTQMRINLDCLLKWAHQANLASVADEHFTQLNAVLDLLSLPKKDLIRSTWEMLTRTFPALSHIQLHYILSRYTIDKRPKQWQPPAHISNSQNLGIRIELATYPTLIIPTRGYRVANSYEVPDSVRPVLSKLTKKISAVKSRLSPTLAPDDMFTSCQTITCTVETASNSIGLKLKKTASGSIIISDIVFNTPAQKCGAIELRDELVCINGTSVAGTSISFCKRLILDSPERIILTLNRKSIS